MDYAGDGRFNVNCAMAYMNLVGLNLLGLAHACLRTCVRPMHVLA